MDEDMFRDWLREQIPDEVVSILDVKRYRTVENAISTICSIFESASVENEDEDKPKYSVRFDRLTGTDLGFSVDITNIGISFTKEQFDVLYNSLPDDVVIGVDPLLNEKARISFNFRNVKRILSAG